VAALVAQGQTNRQIATAMFVTQNTVQTHIRHIFQKLEVSSRTQLAARLLSAPAAEVAEGNGATTRSHNGNRPYH
jgi:DNA-binding NarL/FixJ family response regulator